MIRPNSVSEILSSPPTAVPRFMDEPAWACVILKDAVPVDNPVSMAMSAAVMETGWFEDETEPASVHDPVPSWFESLSTLIAPPEEESA